MKCLVTIRDEIELEERGKGKATKLVHLLTDLPYNKRLEALGMPKLQFRRHRADMLQVLKIIQVLEDVPCSNFFRLNEKGL